MDPQAQEVVEKLKGANNVLVTVSANPSVDQLAAAIGLTLFLNKLKKHATAVFSGSVPSTIEFLKPEETLEKNTDSLRDFIIALDKAKADKLRYKVEENVVKIFITPYKTSITDADLDFSQGDFNVDVVLCVGVHDQADLDQAITAHGRILHDAVVTSISTQQAADFASVNWLNPSASSLSEMAVTIVDNLGREHVDGQIATALLTGVVAETERFSNDKTSPETMRLSAELMAAGANQQLVASELQAPAVEAFTEVENQDEELPAEAPVNQDGTLEIEHPGDAGGDSGEDENVQPVADAAVPDGETSMPETESGEPDQADEPVDTTDDASADEAPQPASRMILQPPVTGGTLTANSVPEGYGSAPDPLTMLTGSSMSSGLTMPMAPDEPAHESEPESEPESAPLVLPDVVPTTDEGASEPLEPPIPPVMPEAPAVDLKIDPNGNIEAPEAPAEPSAESETLTDLEQSVGSSHLQADSGQPAAATSEDAVDDAREEVLNAIKELPVDSLPPEPQAASGATGYLNVQDLENDVPTPPSQPPAAEPPVLLDETPATSQPPAALPLPPSLTPPPADPTPPSSANADATSPPPVPPPLDPAAITQIMSQSSDSDTPKAA